VKKTGLVCKRREKKVFEDGGTAPQAMQENQKNTAWGEKKGWSEKTPTGWVGPGCRGGGAKRKGKEEGPLRGSGLRRRKEKKEKNIQQSTLPPA